MMKIGNVTALWQEKGNKMLSHFRCVHRQHNTELTHLCLMFHYWNSSDVGVIYILLRKVICRV